MTPPNSNRYALIRHERFDRETFYLAAMNEDSQIVFGGDEMTEAETFTFFRDQGMSDAEIKKRIEHARALAR